MIRGYVTLQFSCSQRTTCDDGSRGDITLHFRAYIKKKDSELMFYLIPHQSDQQKQAKRL